MVTTTRSAPACLLLLVLACVTVAILVNFHEEGAASFVKEDRVVTQDETSLESHHLASQPSSHSFDKYRIPGDWKTLIDFLKRAKRVKARQTSDRGPRGKARGKEWSQSQESLLGATSQNPLGLEPSPLGLEPSPLGLTPDEVAQRVISMQTKIVNDARAMSEELAAGMKQCENLDRVVLARASALKKTAPGSALHSAGIAALKQAKLDASFAYDTLCSDVQTSHNELIRVRKTFSAIIDAMRSKTSNPLWLRHLNTFMRNAVHQLRSSYNAAKSLVFASEYQTPCKGQQNELNKKPYKPSANAIELKMKHAEASRKAARKENSQKYNAAKKRGAEALRQKKLDTAAEVKAKQKSAAYKSRSLKEKEAASAAHKTYVFIKVTELKSKAALKMAKRVKKQEEQLREAEKEDASSAMHQSQLAHAHTVRIHAEEHTFRKAEDEQQHLAAVAQTLSGHPVVQSLQGTANTAVAAVEPGSKS